MIYQSTFALKTNVIGSPAPEFIQYFLLSKLLISALKVTGLFEIRV